MIVQLHGLYDRGQLWRIEDSILLFLDCTHAPPLIPPLPEGLRDRTSAPPLLSHVAVRGPHYMEERRLSRSEVWSYARPNYSNPTQNRTRLTTVVGGSLQTYVQSYLRQPGRYTKRTYDCQLGSGGSCTLLSTLCLGPCQ